MRIANEMSFDSQFYIRVSQTSIEVNPPQNRPLLRRHNLLELPIWSDHHNGRERTLPGHSIAGTATPTTRSRRLMPYRHLPLPKFLPAKAAHEHHLGHDEIGVYRQVLRHLLLSLPTYEAPTVSLLAQPTPPQHLPVPLLHLPRPPGQASALASLPVPLA